MKLYTAQMAMHRKVTNVHNLPILDTTVMSGDKRFAPTWEVLNRYKRNDDIPAREKLYVEEFYALMRRSFTDHKAHWLEVLSQDSLCLLCYCKAGKFCHRLLLVEIFKAQCEYYGIPFSYEGEITT